jgi:hypothetical protein
VANDLLFNILARVRGEKDVDKLGRAIDDLSKKLGSLNKTQVAGGFAALSSAAAPALGLMLAVPGAATAAGAAFGVLAAAAKGVGGAIGALAEGDLEEIQEAMANLSPAARSFAVEADGVRRAWGDVRDELQDSLFKPLIGDLEKISSAYLPSMKRDLPGIATAWGQAGDALADWASSVDSVERVSAIVRGTGPIVASLGRSVENLADAWLTLGAESMPVVTELFGMVERLTGGVRNWVAEARQSGQLSAVFTETSQTVGILEDTLASAGRAVGSLFANPAVLEAANTLFGTLNVGVHAVEALTNAFSSLPDGVQSTLVVMGAASVASSKLSAATASLGGSLVNAGPNLERFGERGKTAATKVGALGQKVAEAAGRFAPWVGAILPVGAALVTLGQAAAKAGGIVERDVGKMATALRELATTGKITGELKNVVGNSLTELGRRANEAAANWEAAVKKYPDMTRKFARGAAADLDQLREDLKTIDQGLVQLAESGGPTQAKLAFEELIASMQKANVPAAEINKAFTQYRATAAQMVAANSNLALGFGSAEQNARTMANGLEAAVQSGQKLTDVFNQLNGVNLNADQAMLRVRQSMDAVRTAFQQNGTAITGNTQAALANRVAIGQMTTAINQAAQARLEQARTTMTEADALREADKVWHQEIATLRAFMTQAGLSKEKQDALLASIGAMPPSKQTQVSTPGATVSKQQVDAVIASLNKVLPRSAQIKTPGAPGSRQQVDAVYSALARLPKEVQIDIVTRHLDYFNSIGPGSTNAAENRMRGNRWGGIYSFAGGGMTPAHIARGDVIRYAEPETGGEAFIPRRGNTRRSRNIAQTVVEDWLGGRVTWPGSGAQRGGGPGRGAGGGRSGAGGTDGADIVAELRRLRREITGMQIVLDGRAVGRIQGREADLRHRTG